MNKVIIKRVAIWAVSVYAGLWGLVGILKLGLVWEERRWSRQHAAQLTQLEQRHQHLVERRQQLEVERRLDSARRKSASDIFADLEAFLEAKRQGQIAQSGTDASPHSASV